VNEENHQAGIEKFVDKVPGLNFMAKIFGITPQRLAETAFIIAMLLVMLGVGSTYISCTIGVVYPLFRSFVALESPD